MPHVDRMLNGVKIPSVTEVLAGQEEPEFIVRWRTKEVKKNPRWGAKFCEAKSNRGKRVGTDTHTLIEWYLRNPEVWKTADCLSFGGSGSQWVYTGEAPDDPSA